MSEERQNQAPNAKGPKRMLVDLGRWKSSHRVRFIGLPEIAGLVAAFSLALMAILSYFYFLAPAHSRLEDLQLHRAQLKTQVSAEQKEFKESTTAGDVVKNINASIEEFETRRLPNRTNGRLALYAELNRLMRSNDLRNTSGPTYTTLEALGTKPGRQAAATAGRQSNVKWQSLYPGISVNVTVEGSYQNLRHFVRDIETSRQLLIINAVELESATQSGRQQALGMAGETQTNLPAPRTRPSAESPSAPTGVGTLVSLRLDMSTYFQRATSGGIPSSDTGSH